MKQVLLSLMICLFSALNLQAYTVYQFDRNLSLEGECYSNRTVVAVFTEDEKSSCKAEAEQKNQEQAEPATIDEIDMPATGEIQQHHHGDEVVRKIYFCLKNDQELERRLARRICQEHDEARQEQSASTP